MGLAAETLHQGSAGTLMRASKALTRNGRCRGGVRGPRPARRRDVRCLAARRVRLHRFGIFHTGQASARDPKYTVIPQRERRGQGEARTGATSKSKSKSKSRFATLATQRAS